MQQVIEELNRVRRRGRLMLIAQRGAVMLGWTLAILLAVVLIDFVLRLPAAMRLAILLGGIGALAYATWTYLRLAIIFKPSLTQMALRVEDVLPAVSGRLASSVEFAMAGADRANPLAARSVSETERRLDGESVRIVIKPGRTWRDLAALLAIVGVVVVLAAADPATASTGFKRILLPYSATKWPARTGVESLMGSIVSHAWVYPRGAALPLRAKVTRGSDDQTVYALYRARNDGGWGAWQRIVLTHQGSGVHERLVDTHAERIELYFRTDDDATEDERIELIPPPAVTRASLAVEPPAYAAGRMPGINAELGQGLDQRAVTETASLIGSQATLRLLLNKQLPAPDAAASDRDLWLRATLGWTHDVLPEFEVDAGDPATWVLRWTIEGTTPLTLALRDQYGLTNADAIVYRIEAVEDRLPAITITQPPSDESVLATALVRVEADARDDVALTRVALEAHVQASGGSADEAILSAAAWSDDRDVSELAARAAGELDLASLPLSVGDTVLLSGVAQDVFELHGVRHEPVRSSLRRLRVIDETEFATQLRRQLGGVRQNAIRIEAMQGELQDDVSDDGVQPGMDRAQAQIGDRIAAQRQAVQEVERLLQQNRLEDAQLSQIVSQTKDLLDFAGRSANKAVEAMEQAQASPDAREGARPDESPQRPKQDVIEAQQEVRDELADLIKLLDRDEDTWVVKRQLENLLQQQARLEEATARLGDQTLGRRPEELTEAQRGEAERIAQEQRDDLRDQARQLVEEMRTRSQALKDVDPESAQAMQSAADTAEQRQLDRDMEDAAGHVEQNQMTSATARQQSAQQTLQQMLESIEEQKRAKAQQLIRQLASLIESIERLIVVQEGELSGLLAAMETQQFANLDRGMIRLNQNTEAVAAEARMAGQETRRIARLLDRAADAQGSAVAALREQPVNSRHANEAEERSLALLKDAKAAAEELQRQTEQEEAMRRREELIAAYRAFAEQEVALRGQTSALVQAAQLDRRQLVEARRLGAGQEDIRRGLNNLRDTTAEILDAPIFNHAHRSIDGWAASVSENLFAGSVSVDVTDRQQMIAETIGRLIEALESTMPQPEEFVQQSQGGESGQPGQGQTPLIPPVAQLKLLRGLQQQIYNQTRTIDARADLDAAQRRTRLRELGDHQRELMNLGAQMAEALSGSQPSQPSPAEPPVEQVEPPEDSLPELVEPLR